MKKTLSVLAVIIMLVAGTGDALASDDKVKEKESCDIEWYTSLVDTFASLIGDGWEDFWAGGDGWEVYWAGGDGWEDFWGGGDGWEDFWGGGDGWEG